MPRSSGTYTPPAGQPVVTATSISSSVFNALVADVGNEITNSVPRDGSAPPTANMPMGGYRMTGMGDGVAAQDSATVNQTVTALAASAGSSLVGHIGDNSGAVASTVQATLRKIFNTDVAGVSSQGFSFLSKVLAESIDGTDGSVGKVDCIRIAHTYGGSTAKGGRHGLEVFSALTSATSATNPDRNYVGAAFTGAAYSDDGGIGGARRGAVFGINPVVSMQASATNFANASGIEVNTNCVTGSSMDYKSGIQIVGFPTDTVQGSIYDCCISLSTQVGAVGAKTGILFSAANGKQPISAGGALIEAVGSSTVAYGLKLNTYTFTSAVLSSNNFALDNNGNLAMSNTNAAIEMGSKASSGTPFIDFNSSGLGFDYDARIIASGGSASAGKGTLSLTASTVAFNGANVFLEIGGVGVSNTPFLDFHSSATANDYDFRIQASGGGASSGLGALTFTGSAMLFNPVDIRMNNLGNYANDTAAAAGGIQIGGLYRNGTAMLVRVV